MKPRIIFEDDQILVVDKPAGLVVNRSETIKEGTLQDQLSKYFNLGKNLGIGDRAGIVHRLDRETSGLLLVAKTQEVFDNLQRQFKEREVVKEYIALVHGLVKDNFGTIEARLGRIGKFGKFGVPKKDNLRGWGSFNPVGWRQARTDFKVVSHYQLRESRFNVLIHQNKLTRPRINYLKHHAKDYTLLHLFPKTGRTHQVRVHLKSIGHPIVSDLIYTPKKLVKFDLLWCSRLFLHAKSLEFIHPKTKRRQKFNCDLPKDLKGAILNLNRLTTKA